MTPATAWCALAALLCLAGPAQAAPDARQLVAIILARGDNAGLPFLVVDKAAAEVRAYAPNGMLQGVTPALLGRGRGDISPPGIGDRPLASIVPADRITPSGRFVASIGRDLHQDLLWIDYAAALSLHRVVTSNPAERRLQRLATLSVDDNRISFGCINVPARFYDIVVRPLFTGTTGIVYILPETGPADLILTGNASGSGHAGASSK